jgi:hypothetical protein
MAASEYYGIDQWLASACDIPVDYSNREVVVKKRLSFDDSRDAMIARFSTRHLMVNWMKSLSVIDRNLLREPNVSSKIFLKIGKDSDGWPHLRILWI